tara:strand:+ start:1359 stop:1535 length:177 start_codon:yes stop_codon:yes gene_type:complete
VNENVKTYKREVAIGMLLGFCGIIYTGDTAMVDILVWPVVGFAAGAFGLDAAAKQWSK